MRFPTWHSIKTRLKAGFFVSAPRKFEAIVYFDADGTRTRWQRSAREWLYIERQQGGYIVRIPRPDARGRLMPKPHAAEVLCRQTFASRTAAFFWAVSKLRGFSNLAADVYPL